MSIKIITFDEVLKMFDESVHDRIRYHWDKPGTVGLVVFENMVFDSSAFGARSCLPVGEPWTYKTIKECEGKWLNDLPSQRQYPTHACERTIPISTVSAVIGQVKAASEKLTASWDPHKALGHAHPFDRYTPFHAENPEEVPQQFRYFTYCGGAGINVDNLHEMIDCGVPVSWDTFRRRCQGAADFFRENLGYYKNFLTPKYDPGVSFAKSVYGGIPCYYFSWSSTEFIWLWDDRLGIPPTHLTEWCERLVKSR